MSGNLVLIEAFARVQQMFARGLSDITAEELAYRPHVESNSVAWLGWHLTRWQDAQVSQLAGLEQEWLNGWCAKFGRQADAAETGMGHTSDDVAGLKATAELLVGYHEAVQARTRAFLEGASEADLEREFQHPVFNRPFSVRSTLIGVLADNFAHAGQMSYLRGLIAGSHWGRA